MKKPVYKLTPSEQEALRKDARQALLAMREISATTKREG